jgi:hypothetical protein
MPSRGLVPRALDVASNLLGEAGLSAFDHCLVVEAGIACIAVAEPRPALDRTLDHRPVRAADGENDLGHDVCLSLRASG